MTHNDASNPIVRASSLFTAEIYYPQATITALVGAVTGEPRDARSPLGQSAESEAQTDRDVGMCRDLRLLPESLLASIEEYRKAIRSACAAASALLQVRGIPEPPDLTLLMLASAMSPDRAEPAYLAAANDLTMLFPRARALQADVNAYAQATCVERYCVERYEQLLQDYRDSAV